MGFHQVLIYVQVLDKVMTEHTSKTTEHTSKHTLLTIPTELTEKIAWFTPPSDLLNLRLVNKELADRTVDAFTGVFLEKREWSVYDEFLMKKLEYLETEPKFALSIKHLSLVFDCTQGCADSETPRSDRLVEIINSLLNLRSIALDGVYDCDTGYKFALKKIRLPGLETLVFNNCQIHPNIFPVSDLLNNHNQTLKSVIMRDLEVMDYTKDKPKTWINLLQAATTLHNESIVEIVNPILETHAWNGPTIYIAFFPHSDAVTASEDAAVDVSFNGRRRVVRYRTEAGNLHGSLGSMVQNYREFESWDDMVGSRLVQKQKLEEVGSEGAV